MTKCIAAAFRYKSRRVANFFWRWKFLPQHIPGGRSTIHGATQRSALDADSEVADLIQKYKLFNQDASANESREELITEENIEDGDEATISNKKKQEFEQPVQYAGPEKREYDFTPEEIAIGENQQKAAADPTKKPDDGTPKPQIFYQILNSKNKDFGGILRTSNSASSVVSYEEIGGNKQQASQHAVDANQVTQAAFAKSRAAKCAEKFLSLKLRRVIRKWRQETDLYLSEVKFRLRSAKLQLQRQKVIRMIALKVNNEKARLREIFHAFSLWHLETQVEKRAYDRRQ